MIQNDIVVAKLSDVGEVMSLWPEIASASESRGSNLASVLQTVLRCVQHGAFFLVLAHGQWAGFACVEEEGRTGRIYCLPADPNHLGLGKIVMKYLCQWARLRGLTALTITSEHFNGSAYKYFERTLGFRRESVTFVRKI